MGCILSIEYDMQLTSLLKQKAYILTLNRDPTNTLILDSKGKKLYDNKENARYNLEVISVVDEYILFDTNQDFNLIVDSQRKRALKIERPGFLSQFYSCFLGPTYTKTDCEQLFLDV